MSIGTTIIPSARQVIYGIYASFPSGGLSVGDLAWATDRKCLYRWSGSAWETIGISSRNGDYADIGDAADYPESSLYQADDIDRLYMVVAGAWEAITYPQAFSIQNDVTGSRAVNTIYQNTTGKTLFVVASLLIAAVIFIIVYTDSNTPPTTQVVIHTLDANLRSSISFMVLPNNYYELVPNTGTPTVESWVEWH